MIYRSTRNIAPPVGFGAALRQGLAPDGGLYVPAEWPAFTPADFGALESLPAIGTRLISPFAAGDALAAHLDDVTRSAFRFPCPCGRSTPRTLQRASFTGRRPRSRMSARAFAFASNGCTRPATPVNIPWRRQTGGAVAAAFHRRPGLAVTILFPKGWFHRPRSGN